MSYFRASGLQSMMPLFNLLADFHFNNSNVLSSVSKSRLRLQPGLGTKSISWWWNIFNNKCYFTLSTKLYYYHYYWHLLFLLFHSNTFQTYGVILRSHFSTRIYKY